MAKIGVNHKNLRHLPRYFRAKSCRAQHKSRQGPLLCLLGRRLAGAIYLIFSK
jgi:hypothetical protein